MAELLIELFSEEIPARMQKKAADDLKRLVLDGLKGAGLEHSSADAYVTPRRLALVVDGLPEKQPDVSEERRGPKADAPEKALQGFLGSVGLTIDQVEKRETPKGTFLYAVIEKKGAATDQVLPQIILDAVSNLPWPKSQKWAKNSMRWVRPLHSVIGLFDGKPLSGTLDLGDWKLDFGASTKGHRFLAPDAFEVASFADYKSKLEAARVILDREDRKRIILEKCEALAAKEGLKLRNDPGLLEEVCGLVEWPEPVIGKIDDEFMDVPQELLVLTMREHQKYFALEDADGKLANRFITISNMIADPARDATIVTGNERVLRARLADAKFYWDTDVAEHPERWVPKLDEVTFYDKLGTVGDKIKRVAKLAVSLSEAIPGADADQTTRAAELAKTDLVSGVVYEFPELQGVMGKYYAARHGEPEAISEAIAEHYSPVGPGDDCPSAPVSVAVAFADKLDTLVGFFAIDEKPTGSKDPFALRRAALGIIRLIIENDLRVSLSTQIENALSTYSNLRAADGLMDFFADRLKVHLREEGTRHDLIEAVFALGNEDDLVRLLARVKALQDFLGTDEGANLLAAYKRAANIVRIEEKKDDRSYEGEAGAGTQAEETALVDALAAANTAIKPKLEAEDFVGVMAEMAKLRGPVDQFFDAVTVNADNADERENRLKLLSQIVATANQVADFSKIEG